MPEFRKRTTEQGTLLVEYRDEVPKDLLALFGETVSYVCTKEGNYCEDFHFQIFESDGNVRVTFSNENRNLEVIADNRPGLRQYIYQEINGVKSWIIHPPSDCGVGFICFEVGSMQENHPLLFGNRVIEEEVLVLQDSY